MRIYVTYESNRKDGSSIYILHPKSFDDAAGGARLQELLPRINAMAERQFGEDFISLEPTDWSPNLLDLKVKSGTTRKNRFEKRAFFGWVELFDDEPTASV